MDTYRIQAVGYSYLLDKLDKNITLKNYIKII